MKIAKKILLTLLSTMMSVSLFACGNTNSNAGSNSLGKSNSGKVSTKGDYKTGKEINISKTKLKYLDALVTNTFAMDDSSTSDSVMSIDAPYLLSTSTSGKVYYKYMDFWRVRTSDDSCEDSNNTENTNYKGYIVLAKDSNCLYRNDKNDIKEVHKHAINAFKHSTDIRCIDADKANKGICDVAIDDVVVNNDCITTINGIEMYAYEGYIPKRDLTANTVENIKVFGYSFKINDTCVTLMGYIPDTSWYTEERYSVVKDVVNNMIMTTRYNKDDAVATEIKLNMKKADTANISYDSRFITMENIGATNVYIGTPAYIKKLNVPDTYYTNISGYRLNDDGNGLIIGVYNPLSSKYTKAKIKSYGNLGRGFFELGKSYVFINTGNEKNTKETVISTEDITTDNITYKKIISDVNVPVKETANGTTGGMYKMYTYVFRVDSLEYYIQGVVTYNKDETKMQEYMASMESLLNDMINSVQIQ